MQKKPQIYVSALLAAMDQRPLQRSCRTAAHESFGQKGEASKLVVGSQTGSQMDLELLLVPHARSLNSRNSLIFEECANLLKGAFPDSARRDMNVIRDVSGATGGGRLGGWVVSDLHPGAVSFKNRWCMLPAN